MTHLSAAAPFLLSALLLWCPSSVSGEGVARASLPPGPTPPPRYAWVTIYYEAGRNDDEYFLGARVLMQSIKESGTAADRVVLTSSTTKQKYVDGFRKDGCIVRWVDNIESPWGGKTQQRFAFALNKLKIWSMTEYERVIFLDADVIVLQHADFLFQCGHFCAVFFNPINFHTAILVVKPSQKVYEDMLAKLRTLNSFDGADQGFINAYFTGLNAAPEWTRGKPPSEDAMNRLPVPYNMHHIYYYEKMSWGGPWGDAKDIITMTYPIASFGKPWWWWCYPLMDMHWLWLSYRMRVESVADYPMQAATLLLVPLVHVGLTWLQGRYQPPPRMSMPEPESSPRPGIWCAWGRVSTAAAVSGTCLASAAIFVASSVTPGITPPSLAWPVFLSYYTLALYHGASFLWKHLFSSRLRLNSVHLALFAAPWILYFAAGAYPAYPHGLVKLVFLTATLIVSAGCNVALFKTVVDSNLRQGEGK